MLRAYRSGGIATETQLSFSLVVRLPSLPLCALQWCETAPLHWKNDTVERYDRTSHGTLGFCNMQRVLTPNYTIPKRESTIVKL